MIPEGDPIRSLLVEPLPQRSEFCKAEILLANVEAELEGHKRKSRLRIRGIDQGVEQVVELVRRNILTQMDGRDLARCLSLEAGNDTIAYCVSMEKGSQYGKRHLHANFNNAKCCENMRKVWGPKVRFRQIILDCKLFLRAVISFDFEMKMRQYIL